MTSSLTRYISKRINSSSQPSSSTPSAIINPRFVHQIPTGSTNFLSKWLDENEPAKIQYWIKQNDTSNRILGITCNPVYVSDDGCNLDTWLVVHLEIKDFDPLFDSIFTSRVRSGFLTEFRDFRWPCVFVGVAASIPTRPHGVKYNINPMGETVYSGEWI